jgi:hypothetical protein
MPLKSAASLSVITTLKPKPRIVPPNRQSANQIANQLRGTERYQAIQGRIVEAKLANQGTQLATGRDRPA